MNDQELAEYSQWMWADTAKQLAQAAMVYAVPLTIYWTLVA